MVRYSLLNTAIEMYEGDIKLLAMGGGQNPPGKVFFNGTRLTVDNVYGHAVPMLGTSIGRDDNAQGSGSLGFYVKAGNGTKTAYFGVTCHHVLVPDGRSSASLVRFV